MTKSFDDIVSNFKDPRSEWEVFVNGEAYNEVIELLEFRQSLNSPVEFTVRLKGLPEGVEIPEDAEVVIKKSGLTVLRGVAQEFKPDSFNQYQLKGAGYSAELEGDSKEIVEAKNGVSNPFKSSSVTEIVDTLIDGATINTASQRVFSTNYSLDNSLSVDDFRANSKQLEDVNRLMGEYGIEWYLSFDGSNNPVFNVTDQIQNDDGGGGSIGTLKTYGSDQTAEKVNQNVNRNKGSFDGVKVRGYGDGDDQITASAGSIGKDSRVLIYTDKTILSDSQAQKRADALNQYKTVVWQEIEVKPNNPNALYSIGDLLTVDSEKAYLSDDYRVVKSYYKIWPGENQFESKLNLSNKPQTFLSEFQGEKAKRESQTDYMQGARNIWSDKEAANATNAEPLTIDFEVPQDVIDKAGNNRLDRIEFNYASDSYRQSGVPQTINVDNFDPGVKQVDTSVNVGGVEIERENIDEHNHPVGSATSKGASALDASGGLFFSQSIAASNWTKIASNTTSESVITVDNAEKDLAHEFEFNISSIQLNSGSSRDIQFALLGSTNTPTASFSYSPGSPETGEFVDFVSTSGPGRVFRHHWRIENTTDGFITSYLGRDIEHVFDRAEDHTVTLEIFDNLAGQQLISSNSSSNTFTFPGDITADLEVGDKVLVSGSDGNDGTYTIDSFTTDVNSDTVITVVENVRFSFDDTTDGDVGSLEYFSSANATDSVTETVSVTSSVNSLSSEDQRKVEVLDKNFGVDKELVAQRMSYGEEFEEVASEQISAQTSAGISIDNPADGDVLRLDGTETITFSGSVFDTGNGGTLTARLLQLPGSVISTVMYTENIPANNQDFANFVTFSGDRSFDDSSNDNFDGFGEYDWSAFYDEDNDGAVEQKASFTLYSADPSITSISDTDTQSPVIDFEGAAGVGVNQMYLNIDGSQVKSYNTSPDRKTSRDMSIGEGYEHGDYTMFIEGGNNDNNTILVNFYDSNDDIITTARLENNDSIHVNNDLVVGTEQVFFNFNDNTWTIDFVSYLDENNDITEAKETFTKELVNRDNPQTEPLRGFLYGNKIVFLNVFGYNATGLTTYINGSQQNNMTSTGVHPVNSGNPSAGKIKISKIVDNDDLDSVVVEKYVDGSYEASEISDGQHDTEIVFEAENTTDGKGDETLSDLEFFDTNLNNPPAASFSFSPTDPEAFEAVQFTDESGDPDGDEDIVEWRWDFGDGTTETITSDANTVGDGSTSHSFSSEGDYPVSLTVEDSAGTTDTYEETVFVTGVDSLDETIVMDSQENIGGSPETVSSSTLETSGETIVMGSSNNIGALSSPADNQLMSINYNIPPKEIREQYELYVATQGSDGIANLDGDVEIITKNHAHDIPRQDDFSNTDASVGAGAENKEIAFQKSSGNRGDVLLDFSTNDETITLDTTLNGNDVTITVEIVDSNGEVVQSDTITANNGTATTTNTYQQDDDPSTGTGATKITIDSANNAENFEVRDQSGDDTYTLAAVTADSFQSDKTSQLSEGVSGDDGENKDIIEDVSADLLAGSVANNVRIYIDDDPDQSYTISSISGDTITVAQDVSSVFSSGDDFAIEQSVVNNGQYTVSSVSGTDITVNENIPDPSISDGAVNKNEEITGALYGGSSNSGTPKDKELDISAYVDDAGWYKLKIRPDQPSFIKSRVFLDHHKDTE